MKERQYRVGKINGLHARPSAELLKIAKQHGCALFIKINEQWQPAGIMNLLLLGAGEGACVHLGVEGPREAECLKAIAKVLGDN